MIYRMPHSIYLRGTIDTVFVFTQLVPKAHRGMAFVARNLDEVVRTTFVLFNKRGPEYIPQHAIVLITGAHQKGTSEIRKPLQCPFESALRV